MLFLLATAKTAFPSEASPSEPYDSSFRQLIYIAYFITIEYLYDLNIGHFWKKKLIKSCFYIETSDMQERKTALPARYEYA
jgi:hypothetical protein